LMSIPGEPRNAGGDGHEKRPQTMAESLGIR
jgi:hypothetical protein